MSPNCGHAIWRVPKIRTGWNKVAALSRELGRYSLEAFSRICHVIDKSGTSSVLTVSFILPEMSERHGCYMASAHIVCDFFEKDVYGAGEDQAAAFFNLPKLVWSYLMGQRRFGYEAYWLKEGDLDQESFWT